MFLKRTKYGNKKIESDGQKFDSRLEMFMYKMLEAHGVDFKFQVEIELIPPHKIKRKSVRRTFMKVDFVIDLDGELIYVDTKGFPTDVAKLKYKMLGYKKSLEGANFDIVWLKNKKEVINFVNKISKNE